MGAGLTNRLGWPRVQPRWMGQPGAAGLTRVKLVNPGEVGQPAPLDNQGGGVGLSQLTLVNQASHWLTKGVTIYKGRVRLPRSL